MKRTDWRRGARLAVVVLTVVLVALAGCNTGAGTQTTTDATTTTTEMTSTTTTAAPTTTPTPDSTPTPTPESTPTPTPTEPSGPSTQTLTQNHFAQLQAAGTFTSNVSISLQAVQNGNTTTLDLTQESQLNLDQAVGIESVRSEFAGPTGNTTSTGTTYTSGAETFVRFNVPGSEGVQYRYGQEPYNSSDPIPINFSSFGGESLFSGQNTTWDSRGTTTRNGETLTRYTAAGVESMADIAGSLGTSYDSIENVNGTLLIAESGVVRHMNIHVTGEASAGGTTTIVVKFTTTAVGSTTVPTPQWLDDARQNG